MTDQVAGHRPTFRAGDHVKHGPSGEEWVLACDEDGERVIPAGWPESMADVEHCTLTKAATDDERLEMLRSVAAHRNGGRRQLVAARQLRELTGEGEIFYLENLERGPVGNCVQWWAKGNHGYTCDIREAREFTVDEARAEVLGASMGNKYTAWPKSIIEQHMVTHVRAEPLHRLKGMDLGVKHLRAREER